MPETLASLSDAELNRKAAEAMGWTDFGVREFGEDGLQCISGLSPNGDYLPLPSPATSISDAVEFAEWWRAKQPEETSAYFELASPCVDEADPTWRAVCWVPNERAALASSPARALTLAVLKAMEG